MEKQEIKDMIRENIKIVQENCKDTLERLDDMDEKELGDIAHSYQTMGEASYLSRFSTLEKVPFSDEAEMEKLKTVLESHHDRIIMEWIKYMVRLQMKDYFKEKCRPDDTLMGDSPSYYLLWNTKKPDVITDEENRELNKEILSTLKNITELDEEGDYDFDVAPDVIDCFLQEIETYFWLKHNYYYERKNIGVHSSGSGLVDTYFRIGRKIKAGEPIEFPKKG